MPTLARDGLPGCRALCKLMLAAWPYNPCRRPRRGAGRVGCAAWHPWLPPPPGWVRWRRLPACMARHASSQLRIACRAPRLPPPPLLLAGGALVALATPCSAQCSTVLLSLADNMLRVVRKRRGRLRTGAHAAPRCGAAAHTYHPTSLPLLQVDLAAMRVQCSVYGLRPLARAGECTPLLLPPALELLVLPSSAGVLQFYDVIRWGGTRTRAAVCAMTQLCTPVVAEISMWTSWSWAAPTRGCRVRADWRAPALAPRHFHAASLLLAQMKAKRCWHGAPSAAWPSAVLGRCARGRALALCARAHVA